MVVMKRVAVLSGVVIALVTAAAAGAGITPLSAAQSSYLNFALTPSQVSSLVMPSTATPDTAGFATFKLVDPAHGIARYKIWAPNLPEVKYGLYADLYSGPPGAGGLVTGLRTTGRERGLVAAGKLDWDALVSDIFSHPGNYSVQLDDVPFPGPFAWWPNYTGLIGGQMDNGFGLSQ